jgi:catechol 2,3-dioxygenase-like lactoylglutathione lyase family enzyme
VRERGIGILLVGKTYFSTKPSETLGVCLQVYAGDWHADPPPAPYVNPLRPPRWWSEHPIGYRGFHHISFACEDLDAAERFWCELTGGTVTHRAQWPASAATAVGLDIGIPIELVAATGPGLIQEYLDRYGPRVWATTFAVRDLGATKEHFATRGIELLPGDAPGSMMVPPEHNHNVVYQFIE